MWYIKLGNKHAPTTGKSTLRGLKFIFAVVGLVLITLLLVGADLKTGHPSVGLAAAVIICLSIFTLALFVVLICKERKEETKKEPAPSANGTSPQRKIYNPIIKQNRRKVK